MPDDIPFRSEEEYVKQWKRNRKCCQAIPDTYADWHVTICFYSALHAVNAAIAHLNQKVFDHKSRNDLVRNREEFAGLRHKYLALYRLSRWTRYDPDSSGWLPPDVQTPWGIYPSYLQPIERQVESIIGKNLNLSDITPPKG